MKNILLILFCCIYPFFALHANAAEKIVRIDPKGITVLFAKAGKSQIKIKIKTHIIDIGSETDKRPEITRSNCTYTKFPCSVVNCIDIFVNGESIVTYDSIFTDIADLNTAKILIDKSKYFLILETGDISNGTIVKIEFNEFRVKGRIVESRRLRSRLEETKYYAITTR